VPDERVAAEELVLLLGQLRDDLTLGEVEHSLLRFGEKPLCDATVSSYAVEIYFSMLR
jgi:hypothetical protein